MKALHCFRLSLRLKLTPKVDSLKQCKAFIARYGSFVSPKE